MVTVTEVNQQIKTEDNLVLAIARLLDTGVAIADWPADEAAALAGAIAPPEDNLREADKAARLREHLFTDLPCPPLGFADPASRQAERLRSDLPPLVPVGAALHLVQEDNLRRVMRP